MLRINETANRCLSPFCRFRATIRMLLAEDCVADDPSATA